MPLAIPRNYYDDLLARFDLPPAEVETMAELGLLHDRDATGDFTHFYTATVGGVFFEVVQRRGGYDGYGAPNAGVRLAAQHRGSTRYRAAREPVAHRPHQVSAATASCLRAVAQRLDDAGDVSPHGELGFVRVPGHHGRDDPLVLSQRDRGAPGPQRELELVAHHLAAQLLDDPLGGAVAESRGPCRAGGR